jgi:hypothetical protein
VSGQCVLLKVPQDVFHTSEHDVGESVATLFWKRARACARVELYT